MQTQQSVFVQLVLALRNFNQGSAEGAIVEAKRILQAEKELISTFAIERAGNTQAWQAIEAIANKGPEADPAHFEALKTFVAEHA